jgi:hypothetical protein
MVVRRPGAQVVDPLIGSGTAGECENASCCGWIGVELSPEYGMLARRRTALKITSKLSMLEKSAS